MFAMVPTNTIALGTLPPDRIKNASGLFNLTRNLGGAVGLAVITTVLDSRWDLHIARLHEAVQWGSQAAMERLNAITQAMTPTMGSDSGVIALQTLSSSVRLQALVMAFSDVFLLLAGIFAA